MEISPAPRILGYIAGFPVTDTFWVAIAISILLILVFTITAKRMKQVPKGLQFWVETIVVGSYDFMHDMTQKKQPLTPICFNSIFDIYRRKSFDFCPWNHLVNL